jgi:hypothetical protein
MPKDKLRDTLLGIIPADGSSIGNVSARRALLDADVGASDSDYWRVRNALIDEGVLRPGRGKGGSVSRVLATEQEQEQEKAAEAEVAEEVAVRQRERDLYEPFAEQVREYWTYENDLEHFVVEITAHQGRRRTGGTWSRPDVALVSVERLPLHPTPILEVTSFELKPESELNVQGVFEAAAHSAFADRSYLAVKIQEEGGEDYRLDRLVSECRRFNIGLIVFTDEADGGTWDVLFDPVTRVPDPREKSRFLTTQISPAGQQQLKDWLTAG